MVGLFEQVKKKVVTSVWKDESEQPKGVEVDNKIALGVLLWAVAEADDKFLSEEETKIKEVLRTYIAVTEKDMPIILNTIEIAHIEKIDLHKFTKEVGQNLPYGLKKNIVIDLFRVACADSDLDHVETETIRKISNLLGIDHKDFIDAKLKVKEEYGIDTVV